MTIKAILTDIEGTTSSISFVHDVLFPYAYEAIPDYLQNHQHDEAVQNILQQVQNEAGIDKDNLTAISQQFRDWIRADKKITPLKTLQGLIWEKGYSNGDFRSHIYDDAYEMLKQWREQGLPLFIYSSGSIRAQQLFFGHTDHGDILNWFSGHFDTNTGAKKAAESYRKISESINLPTAEILFLSDIVEELDAAREAGMHTYWLVRQHGQKDTPQHPVAKNFYHIKF